MTAPMLAVQVRAYGGPDALQLTEIERPVPGPGDALVELAVAGVNYIDVYMRNGTYAKSHTYATQMPMTLGMEGAGRVAAVGAGVKNVAPGDRVGYCLVRGSYAQYAAVPAAKLVVVPDEIPDEVAVALMLQGATAHYLTHSAFALKEGDTCLVHAASGGVGGLLTQLAKLSGARVIATVGSASKADRARANGADEVILYRETDFRSAVLDLTGGRGVDVVYDSVGRDTLPRSLRSVRRRGTVICFGASSGQPAPVELLELAEAGSVFLTRPHLADYMATPDEIAWRAQDLFAAYSSKRLNVAIDKAFPIGQASAAHERLEARQTHGKQLLSIKDGSV